MSMEQHYHVGPAPDGRWSVLLTRSRRNVYGHAEHQSTIVITRERTRATAQRIADRENRDYRRWLERQTGRVQR
ncbi:hypothetical protein KBTX_02470 [wastewater metagenome]|uniref:Uncharacterized protein n=2 Tax=unclassified sequences TaxID=12908 RepID=A0A5B8RBG0_9ZZZZ|nr:hypothetical protein [Arhodomonas sp. KWT]QEA06140.1 hypothetical protein KBTEX_02470 [uncultured organism]